MADVKTTKEMMKKAVRQEQAKERRLPPDKLREMLLNWLAEIKIPAGTDADSWEDLIQVFPVNEDEERDTGLEILFAVRLATRDNRYLITIMRSLWLDHPSVGIVSTHVNWKPTERRMQAAVEKTYTGEFEDILRTKHTLWAQTFEIHEFTDALDSCAVAILSKELTAAPDEPLKVEAIPWCQPPALRVPKPIDEEL